MLLGSRFSIILQVTQLVGIWNFDLHFNSSDKGFLLTSLFGKHLLPSQTAFNLIRENNSCYHRARPPKGRKMQIILYNIIIYLTCNLYGQQARIHTYTTIGYGEYTIYGTISGTRILGARPVTNFDQPRVLACECFICYVCEIHHLLFLLG